MDINIHILYDELKDFNPQINTSRDIDLTLRNVRLPEFIDGNMRQDCVYLAESSDIEENVHLLHGVDVISIGHIDLHEKVFSDLSVISLPEGYSKTSIFGKVQDIFEKYKQ